MDNHKEGELYKSISVGGEIFEIIYGFYDECERGNWPTTPIFPDFLKEPMYTNDGIPFVTASQQICEDYKPKQIVSGEEWCNDCEYFETGEEIIGLCKCEKRRNI